MFVKILFVTFIIKSGICLPFSNTEDYTTFYDTGIGEEMYTAFSEQFLSENDTDWTNWATTLNDSLASNTVYTTGSPLNITANISEDSSEILTSTVAAVIVVTPITVEKQNETEVKETAEIKLLESDNSQGINKAKVNSAKKKDYHLKANKSLPVFKDKSHGSNLTDTNTKNLPKELQKRGRRYGDYDYYFEEPLDNSDNEEIESGLNDRLNLGKHDEIQSKNKGILTAYGSSQKYRKTRNKEINYKPYSFMRRETILVPYQHVSDERNSYPRSIEKSSDFINFRRNRFPHRNYDLRSSEGSMFRNNQEHNLTPRFLDETEKRSQGFDVRENPFEEHSCKQYIEFLKNVFDKIQGSESRNHWNLEFDHEYDYDYEGDNYHLRRKYVRVHRPEKKYPAFYPNLERHPVVYDDYSDKYPDRPDYFNYPETGHDDDKWKQNLSQGNEGMKPNWYGRGFDQGVDQDLDRDGIPSYETTTVEIQTADLTDVTEIKVSSTVKPIEKAEDHEVEEQRLTNVTLSEGYKDNDDCGRRLYPCPDNVNITYPITGYCNRFVVCESGKPTEHTCHDGLHFNLITKQCDLLHNSYCSYTCPEPNGFFGIPGDCNGFFYCKNGYPEYRMCPPHKHWDALREICTYEDQSTCPMKCEESFELKPYTGDCSSYIICHNKIPQYHKCPGDTQFDVNKLGCVPADTSKCTNDKRLIRRNEGLRKLCATVGLKGASSIWCQEKENINAT